MKVIHVKEPTLFAQTLGIIYVVDTLLKQANETSEIQILLYGCVYMANLTIEDSILDVRSVLHCARPE